MEAKTADNSGLTMQQVQEGGIYCAVLASTALTLIFQKEGQNWKQPFYIDVSEETKPQRDPKTGKTENVVMHNVRFTPITKMNIFVDRIPALSPSHILTMYHPSEPTKQVYNQFLEQYVMERMRTADGAMRN